MKTFSCGEVVRGCTATFQGDTEENVLAQVAEHAKSAHGMATVPPDVVEAVRSKIQDRQHA